MTGLVTLVLYFLAAFGCALVLGHSRISLPFRTLFGGGRGGLNGEANPRKPLVPVLGPFLVALVECPMCLGWWQGAFMGWFVPSVVFYAAPVLLNVGNKTQLIGALILSFATSAVNLLLARYVGIA